MDPKNEVLFTSSTKNEINDIGLEKYKDFDNDDELQTISNIETDNNIINNNDSNNNEDNNDKLFQVKTVLLICFCVFILFFLFIYLLWAFF